MSMGALRRKCEDLDLQLEAARFQEQQREHVQAPAIAETGLQPWDGVSVEYARVEEGAATPRPALRSPFGVSLSLATARTGLQPFQQMHPIDRFEPHDKLRSRHREIAKLGFN